MRISASSAEGSGGTGVLRPFVVAGEEAVEDFLRAFAARRFCLDAESADIMLLNDM